ncbi:MAG TPA: hypothetical protein VFA65_05305 [Bryobacteraceae bacterium]|nr:hypothetical protein [Bryobacteraceae bacterium]
MGFPGEGVPLVTLDPTHAGYKDARLLALYDGLLSEARATCPACGGRDFTMRDNADGHGYRGATGPCWLYSYFENAF